MLLTRTLTMFISLTYANNTERRLIVKELRILFATSLMEHPQRQPTPSEIAKIFGIGERKLQKWQASESWQEARAFWNPQRHASLQHKMTLLSDVELTNSMESALFEWAKHVGKDVHINAPDAFRTRRQKTARPRIQVGLERLHWSYFPRQTCALIANYAMSFVISISVIISSMMGVSHE